MQLGISHETFLFSVIHGLTSQNRSLRLRLLILLCNAISLPYVVVGPSTGPFRVLANSFYCVQMRDDQFLGTLKA
jgi:hypothetical protein